MRALCITLFSTRCRLLQRQTQLSLGKSPPHVFGDQADLPATWLSQCDKCHDFSKKERGEVNDPQIQQGAIQEIPDRVVI